MLPAFETMTLYKYGEADMSLNLNLPLVAGRS